MSRELTGVAPGGRLRAQLLAARAPRGKGAEGILTTALVGVGAVRFGLAAVTWGGSRRCSTCGALMQEGVGLRAKPNAVGSG
jgi:hypothetical protein